MVTPPVNDPCALEFTNAAFTAVGSYAETDTVYIDLQDSDLDTDATSVNTLLVTVNNVTSGDFESVTLTETAVNTGVFRNVGLSSSPTTGFSVQDGTLNFAEGETITVSYTDPLFPADTCADSISIPTPPPVTEVKQLYLTGNGGGLFGGLGPN